MANWGVLTQWTKIKTASVDENDSISSLKSEVFVY